MSVNSVTAAIAAKAQRKRGRVVDINLLRMATGRHDLAGYMLERYIHRWLNRFGIRPPSNCGCEHWVQRMNQWGIASSLDHLDEITEQVSQSLHQTYLFAVAVPWLTDMIIKNRIKACLLKGRS